MYEMKMLQAKEGLVFSTILYYFYLTKLVDFLYFISGDFLGAPLCYAVSFIIFLL